MTETQPLLEPSGGREDPELPKASGATLSAVLPVQSLVAVATYMMVPVKLNWATTIACRGFYPEDLKYNDPRCQSAGVQEAVSHYAAFCALIGNVIGLYFLSYYSNLADRKGRRPIFRVFVIGDMLALTFMIVTLLKWVDVSYRWLIVPPVIQGLFGSETLISVLVSAYVTDCTKPWHRTAAMSSVMACVMIGKALGPFLTSRILVLTDQTLYWTCLTALGFDALALAYLMFMPESRSAREDESEEPVQRSGWNEFVWKLNLLAPLATVWKIAKQAGSARRNILILVVIDLLYEMIIASRAGIAILYPEMKFGWTAIEIGYVQSATAVWRIVLLLVLVPLGLRLFSSDSIVKTDEEEAESGRGHSYGISRTQISIIGIGNLLETIGYCGYAFAANGSQYAAAYFVSTTGVMAKPTVQSSLMNLVPAAEVGGFLGAKGVLDGLAKLAFTSLGMAIYAKTVKWKPEFVFYMAATGYFIVVVHSLFLRPRSPKGHNR